MPDIASVLKSEISRLARKESRGETAQLKKATATYRKEIAELKRRLAGLERQIKALGKAAPAKSREVVQEDTASNKRFSAKGLVSLRKRLGMSAEEMGTLLGTSGQSIYNWESGSARPRAESLSRIISLRSVGKREVVRYLESLKQ